MTSPTASGITVMRYARRLLLVLALCWMLGWAKSASAAAPDPDQPDVKLSPNALFSQTVGDAYLCTERLMLRQPSRCPPFGPGSRQVRLAFLRSRLPNPLPALPVETLPLLEDSVTSWVYGHMIDLPAPTYRHPAEAETALPPVRVFQSNINWASVIGSVDYNGEIWYQLNPEEYIAAYHIEFPEPSRFQGVQVTDQPAYPFGWLRRELQPSPEPGAPPRSDITLPRRHLVTIFATEEVGGRRWDMIGPDQWIDHNNVSQVTVHAVPDGVPAGAKWIEVDTYEQTLAAYEGSRLVYATLTTSGHPEELTPLGLFRIFRKVRGALMQSIDRPMDDRYWYYLEDVEHAQFFNDRISLHAAYWHDAFGTVRSNGCVNLSPLDARWLYAWTDPQLPPGGSWVTAEAAGEGQTWVWVHHSAPNLIEKPAP